MDRETQDILANLGFVRIDGLMGAWSANDRRQRKPRPVNWNVTPGYYGTHDNGPGEKRSAIHPLGTREVWVGDLCALQLLESKHPELFESICPFSGAYVPGSQGEKIIGLDVAAIRFIV